MSVYKFDVLIIGSGISGLTSAIKLAEKNIKVGILTREKDPKTCNTFIAQGGIVYSQKSDSFKDDILKASSHTSNLDAVSLLIEKSPEILKEILIEKCKVKFETDKGGGFLFTREACHSEDRILFQGDYTGKEIQIALLNYLKDKKRFPNVSFLTSHTAIDLLTSIHNGVSISQRYEKNRVLGAYIYNQETKEVNKAIAKMTVIASGGIGALYIHHSNSEGARGDGIAMAKRASAIITDMEFIQFHPTTLFNRSGGRRFLLSEALRGEGGVLLNCYQETFMEKYHPDKELASRDIVSRSIIEEMIRTQHDCVYLDIRMFGEERIKNRFPTIYEHCLKFGIDIIKDLIPVVPAAHYTCGGIKSDLNGRTSLENLYAIGEVACTGLHGANRLASTSLLESLTWGYLAGEDIIKNISSCKLYDDNLIKDWEEGSAQVDNDLLHQDWMIVRQTMWNYLGLTRSEERMKRAAALLGELNHEISLFYKNAMLSDALIGLRNAVDVSLLVLNASRRNKNSIGCFYRKF